MSGEIKKIAPRIIPSFPDVSNGALNHLPESQILDSDNGQVYQDPKLLRLASFPILSMSEGLKDVREEPLEHDKDRELRLEKVSQAKVIVGELFAEIKRIESLERDYKHVKSATLNRKLQEKQLLLENGISDASTDSIFKEIQVLNEVLKIKKIKADGGKLTRSDVKRTTYENFLAVLTYYAQKHEKEDILQDKELLSLVLYYYTVNHFGAIPDRAIEHLPEMKEVMAKHYFFDMEKKSSAYDFESLSGLHKKLSSVKLGPVFDGLSLPEVAELVSLGSTKGSNPLIRDWFLSECNMWQGEKGKDRAKRAMVWVLEHAEQVYDREKNQIDLEKIKKVNWAIKLSSEYGLKGMLALCPYADDTLKALRLGLEALGGIGLANKLPRYYITRSHMWDEKEKDGRRLIDDVTDDLISLLRTSHPDLFEREKIENDKKIGEGNLIASKVKRFDAWTESYNSLAGDCLRGSEMTVYEALKRRCSYLCGWNPDQIKEWEMRYKGMWEGKNGKVLFKKALAYYMGVSGLGKFNITDEKLSLSFTVTDIDEWYESVINVGNDNNFRKFMYKKNLSGGLKYSACKDKISGAVRVLFDVPGKDPLPVPTKPDGSPVRRSNLTKEIMKALVSAKGGTCIIELGKAKGESISAEEIQQRTIDVIRALQGEMENPFISGSLTFVNRQEDEIDRVIRSEGGVIPYRYDSFDIRGTGIGKILNNPESSKAKLLRKIRTKLTLNDIDTILMKGDLSQCEIREFLRIVRDDLLDYINVKNTIKPKVKKLINVMLTTRKGLITEELDTKKIVCEIYKSYGRSTDIRTLKCAEVLNKIFDFLKTVLLRNI